MNAESKMLVDNAISSVYALQTKIKNLDVLVKEQEQALVAKQKRISQLQADIQNLLRKNAELKEELKAKDVIINQLICGVVIDNPKPVNVNIKY